MQDGSAVATAARGTDKHAADTNDDNVQDFEPIRSRWFAPGNGLPDFDLRDYEINEVATALNPYHQNRLKGDFPIFGTQDLFLDVTATARMLAEFRDVPTPSGITGPGSVNPNFFGDGSQRFFLAQLAVSLDLFKGQQAFKPVDWRVKVTPVYTYTDLSVEEVGVVNVDVSKGTRRADHDFALQEAFVEVHLLDLSEHYDFLSSEAGILPFRSDFRGFIFDDTNLGARVFGNAEKNRWQYNVVFFDMLDKDTNSGLNTFDQRDQQVVIANVYRQDFLFDGYTAELSFHYNHDHRGVHFDDNGFLVSPAPVGSALPHEIESYYIGVAGEGRFGRFNVTDAFYQALGHDSNNPFAGHPVDINAQLAALEVSYDVDWTRFRLFGMYASGDGDTRDGQARGFDAILSAPNFAGGGFSFFNSQAIRLLGVNLTNAGSALPDLRTSQTQGQSNFVNPGIALFGGALDFDITPKVKAQIGASYLRFQTTASLETYLELPNIDREIGTEVFLGTQWRPLLTNNVIVTVGTSVLFPGEGLQRIYQSSDTLYTVFTNLLFSF
jgi:hypothetical protein